MINVLEKKSQQSKQANNEVMRLEQIIDNIDANIYWKDVHGRFLGMNKANLKTLGKDLGIEDVVGKLISEILPEHSYHMDIHSNDLNVINNNKTVHVEEIYTVDGEKESKVCLSSKSPLVDDLGNVIGMVGVSFDISKQKKLEQKLDVKESIIKSLLHI